MNFYSTLYKNEWLNHITTKILIRKYSVYKGWQITRVSTLLLTVLHEAYLSLSMSVVN